MPAISDMHRKKQELQRLQEIEREQMNALSLKSTSSTKKKKNLAQKSSVKKTKTLKSPRSPRSDASTLNLPKIPEKKKVDSKVAARRTKSKDKTLKEAQQAYPSVKEDLIGIGNGNSEDDFFDFLGEQKNSGSLIDLADSFNTTPQEPTGDLVNLHDDVIYEEDEHRSYEKEPKEFHFPDQKYSNSEDEFPENESESELFQEQQNEDYNRDHEENRENVWEGKHIRDKIFREMEEDKFRELELQTTHNKSYSENIPRKSENQIDELERDEEFIVRRKISRDYDDEDEFSDDSVYMDENNSSRYSHAERIRQELEEQGQRERELNNIHRTLSKENLYDYHSPIPQETEDEETEDEIGQHDTRTKIFEEMELLKKRENELKKKRFYHSQQSLDDYYYDGNNMEEEEEEEEEVQVSVIDQIKQEMYDLQHREEELQRQRPRYNSFESMRTDGSRELNENLTLSKQPIFGSRDDLVAFFGTTEDTKEQNKQPAKKTPRSQHAVKIPKAFRKNSSQQEPRELDQYKIGAPRENTPNRSISKERRAQISKDKSYDRINGRMRQDASERPLIENTETQSNQVRRTRKDKTNKKNDKGKMGEFPNIKIQPIQAKWEKRSEEEHIKKQQIEMEIKKKKEEYMQLLKQKAYLEKQQRLEQQERIKELERKEHERQILRQKKQGLNDLWLSKKPLVTIDDNPDYHDEELLYYPQKPQRENKTNATLIKKRDSKEESKTDKLRISKTIRRWEKRIAKNIGE